MRIAITREVSPTIDRCELTHRRRSPIDVMLARRQHAAYRDLLSSRGWTVVQLPPLPACPDSVFVEDVAIVLDELAVLTRPGAETRRAEVPLMEPMLSRFRSIRSIEGSGTIDGGDVLRVGRRIYLGRTSRTNDEGIRQLREITAPLGYALSAVTPRDCLHLKSAATCLDDDAVLVDPRLVDLAAFDGVETVEIDGREHGAANVVRVGEGEIMMSASAPATRERLERRGLRCHRIDVSELAKAEGALTCCSLLI